MPKPSPESIDALIERCVASIPGLSERQIEVLQHKAQGLTRKEIARRMSICDITVRTYTSRLNKVLGADDRYSSIVLALVYHVATGNGNAVFPKDFPKFARRQSQVAQMGGFGMTDREIGGELGIKEHTVREVKGVLSKKTGYTTTYLRTFAAWEYVVKPRIPRIRELYEALMAGTGAMVSVT